MLYMHLIYLNNFGDVDMILNLEPLWCCSKYLLGIFRKQHHSVSFKVVFNTTAVSSSVKALKSAGARLYFLRKPQALAL